MATFLVGSESREQQAGSTRVVAAALAHQQEKGLVACPSFTAMVFWCGGGLFSAPEDWQKTIFNRVSEGTLDTFFPSGGCLLNRRSSKSRSSSSSRRKK